MWYKINDFLNLAFFSFNERMKNYKRIFNG